MPPLPLDRILSIIANDFRLTMFFFSAADLGRREASWESSSAAAAPSPAASDASFVIEGRSEEEREVVADEVGLAGRGGGMGTKSIASDARISFLSDLRSEDAAEEDRCGVEEEEDSEGTSLDSSPEVVRPMDLRWSRFFFFFVVVVVVIVVVVVLVFLDFFVLVG